MQSATRVGHRAWGGDGSVKEWLNSAKYAKGLVDDIKKPNEPPAGDECAKEVVTSWVRRLLVEVGRHDIADADVGGGGGRDPTFAPD